MKVAQRKITIAVSFVALMLLSTMSVMTASLDTDGTDEDPVATRIVPEGSDYLYALYFDSTNTVVVDVKESHKQGNGYSPLRSVFRTYDTTSDKWTMNEFWKFDEKTGLGPFNSFYAAVNINGGGNNDDAVESRLSTEVGKIAYVLDPNNLKKTLNGNEINNDGSSGHTSMYYNIMLIIPTVYISIVEDTTASRTEGTTTYESAGVLYMSSKKTYTPEGSGTVTGVAWAHTFNTGDSGGAVFEGDNAKTYPYIGLGVYEGYVDNGKMLSVSGKQPSAIGGMGSSNVERVGKLLQASKAGTTVDSESRYQLLNYFQWSLYAAMSYTVMGSMNVKAMIGIGALNSNNKSIGGNGDEAGWYGSNTTTTGTDAYGKLFIENAWGSAWEHLVDVSRVSNGTVGRHVYMGNYLDGKTVGIEKTDGTNWALISDDDITGSLTDSGVSVVYSEGSNVSMTTKTTTGLEPNYASWSWGLPIERDSSSSPGFDTNNPDITSFGAFDGHSGVSFMIVGGDSSDQILGGLGYYYWTATANENSSNAGRLCYIMSGKAVERQTGVNVLSYNANGGSGDAPLRSAGEIDALHTVESNTFTSPSSSSGFAYWNTKADGTGTSYNAEDDITISSNTTLYAIWNYNITWEEDGSHNTNMTVMVNGTAVQSGAIAHKGDIITITPSRGYGIKYAVYNDTVSIENGRYSASYSMPSNSTDLDILIKNEVVVQFDLMGKGRNFSHVYLSGDTLGKVETKVSGLELKGWFLDKQLTKKAEPGYIVSRNVTLYASWSDTPGHYSGYPINVEISGISLTADQISNAIDEMAKGRSQGLTPSLIVDANGALNIQSELLDAMLEYRSRLIYQDQNVRISLPYDTMAGLESGTGFEIVVKKIDSATYPAGKAGDTYDVGLKVGGQDYTAMLARSVFITLKLSSEGLDPSTMETYLVEGTSMDRIESSFSSGYSSFETFSLGRFAVIYDDTALVIVDLNGGSLTVPNDSWKYFGGKYVKYLPVGTTINEVLSDLGSYGMSMNISISASGSANEVTADGLAVTVQWVSIIVVAMVGLIVVVVGCIAFACIHRSKMN